MSISLSPDGNSKIDTFRKIIVISVREVVFFFGLGKWRECGTLYHLSQTFGR